MENRSFHTLEFLRALSLSFSRLYENLHFRLLFQITEKKFFVLLKELNHMHCGIIPIYAAGGGRDRLASPSEA